MKEKLSSMELNMLLPSAFADPLSSKLDPPQYHKGKKHTTKLTTYA
jgi:hypothetical protein